MPPVDQTYLRSLRERVDFYELVSQVTELKPAGAANEYLALCPFHEDHRASLSVNTERGLFNCYACDSGGDVVDFVRLSQGCSFRQAVSFLESFTGGQTSVVTRPKRKLVPAHERAMTSDPRLLDLLERACRRYEFALQQSPEGAAARDYLTSRGIDLTLAYQFRLGFSFGPHQLHRAAEAAGFSTYELEAAGLAQKAKSGDLRDHFRGPRLLFPIADAKGQVRGFSGRTIDDAEPKYFNSRTTSTFIKGQMFFGFTQALDAIRSQGRVIVAEGFVDAVALAGAGFPESVSVMGIAMTKHHAKLLKSLNVPVFVAYDGDEGGARTLPKALDRLREAEVTDIRVVQLAGGHDPASLIAAEGPDAFARLLDAAAPAGEVP